jgi:hypothetical protein
LKDNINLQKVDNRLLIANNHSKIGLEQKDNGIYLVELAALKGENYLKRPTLLWAVEMTNKSKIHAQLDCVGINPTATVNGNVVQLTFASVPISQTKETVDVQITLTFNDLQQVEWRISVLRIPADWSVFRVSFPKFDLAVEQSDDYTFIVPSDRGVAYKNPLKTIPTGGIIAKKRIRHRPYPGGISMQLLALQRRSDLLYFAAHDPVPHMKTFYFEPNNEESIIHLHPYTDTQIQYGADYHSFMWVTACTQGDWYTASQIYRKFALTASWTQRGPLEHGKTPRWYQDIPMVTIRLLRGPGEDVQDLIAERDFIGLPMVSHYYMWHQNAFDADNPYFFPTVPGFRKVIAELKEKQVYVMPYINPYSADTALPEWEHGLKNSAMQMTEEGDLSTTTWSQGNTFAGMCPAAPLWRRIINLLAMRMFEMGIRALYFDEVPVSSPRPCYNPDHDHIPGGGSYYFEAYYAYLKSIREEAGDFCKDLIMTGEGCGEPYMLYLDAFLIGNHNDPQTVPLFEAVYHDYMMGFGRYTFTPELTDPNFTGAIISKFAQQFAWGSQFGWSRPPLAAIMKKDPKTAEFLKHLAHVWVNNADYLARGKMLRPMDLSDQIKPVKRRWAMAWNDDKGTEVELMPVLNSVWQIDDGSVAIVLVNITEKPIDIKVKLPTPQHLLAQMMADGATPETIKQLKSPDYYPIPENTFGMLRQMNGTTMVSSICEGDSEHGFEVHVPALKCVVIAVGSEKKYGVHD